MELLILGKFDNNSILTVKLRTYSGEIKLQRLPKLISYLQ